MTGPAPALSGMLTSWLWLGRSGALRVSGAAGTRPKLFLLNWMANPVMGCMALLVNVISMNISPLRRANVPDTSRPLPLAAGIQTYQTISRIHDHKIRMNSSETTNLLKKDLIKSDDTDYRCE